MTSGDMDISTGAIESPVTTEPARSTEAPVFTPMTQEQFAAKVAAMAPAPSERRTKVAILGFVKHFQQAPFNDPSFEIWGLNELYQFIPRWDRWFEIHQRSLYENDRNRVSDHINKLKAMTCPVYMMQHWDDIPASVPYPLADVMQRWPNPCPAARPYLTNTITYELLLALLEGFQEIHLYGVDMSHSTEYGEQRPSCEYAIGIAQGMGVKVYLPTESELLKANFLYGYEVDAEQVFTVRLKDKRTDIANTINGLDNQFLQLIEARAQNRGAHQLIEHLIKNWHPSADDIERMQKNGTLK